MSERIRWTDNGHGGLIGSVGTIDPWLFQIWKPDVELGEPEWLLTAASVPGMQGVARYGNGPKSLKAEAEELLAQFAASLGAIFPEEGTRTSVQWAVAYGSPDGDPNECAGVLEYDDEADAREHLQWTVDGFLARRTVTSTRWERVGPAAGEGGR